MDITPRDAMEAIMLPVTSAIGYFISKHSEKMDKLEDKLDMFKLEVSKEYVRQDAHAITVERLFKLIDDMSADIKKLIAINGGRE